jgi:hypothetical protein
MLSLQKIGPSGILWMERVARAARIKIIIIIIIIRINKIINNYNYDVAWAARRTISASE